MPTTAKMPSMIAAAESSARSRPVSHQSSVTPAVTTIRIRMSSRKVTLRLYQRAMLRT